MHGRDMDSRRTVARVLDRRIGRIPQVKDTYLPQAMDLPQLKIEVDRNAGRPARSSRRPTSIRNVITALMSSAQLAPNFWIDPVSGNPYVIGVQYPEHLVENIQTLENIPLSSEKTKRRQDRVPLLARRRQRRCARRGRSRSSTTTSHRVSQLFVSVGDNDLAGVATEVDRIVDAAARSTTPCGSLPQEQARTAHAVKIFPKDKGDPDEIGSCTSSCKRYFHDEDPECAGETPEQYGVDVASDSDLAHDDGSAARRNCFSYAQEEAAKACAKMIAANSASTPSRCECCRGRARHGPGRGRQHARVVRRDGLQPDPGGGAGLPGDGGPVLLLARSADHDRGRAAGPDRRRLHALAHRHLAEHPVVHGRADDGRHLGVQLGAAGGVRQPPARARGWTPLEAVVGGGTRRGCGRS